MSFADDLRLQLPDIKQYTENGIAYFSDIRDFIKERIDLEREYADKIDKLAKKYQKNSRKTGVSFYGAGAPFKTDSGSGKDENVSGEGMPWAPLCSNSTAAAAWLTLLQQTEAIARAHVTLADALKDNISTRLKQTRVAAEDALKKHLQFSVVQQGQLDASRQDLDKARDAYKAASAKVEAAFNAYDKYVQQQQASPGDTSHVQKATADWNAAVAEKNERLNDYILALHVYNAHQQRHRDVDQPKMAAHLQVLCENLSQRAKDILTDTVKLDIACLDERRRCEDAAQAAIDGINPPTDSVAFVKAVRREIPPVQMEPFTPFSSVDAEELDTETSRVQLLNQLLALRTNQVKNDADVMAKNRELEAVANLRNTYTQGWGDAEKAHEAYVESERQLLTLELTREKTAVQLEDIEAALGQVEVRAHDTKSTTSGSCVVCGSSFGMFSKGLQCTVCDLRFHPSKCNVKVPPCGHPMPTAIPNATPMPADRMNRGGADKSLRPSKTVSRATRDSSSGAVSTSKSTPSSSSIGSRRDSGKSIYAVVQYDFSPSAEGELAVSANDRVKVLNPDNGSGWMLAEFNGQQGLVPANYCQIETASPSPQPVAAAPPSGGSKQQRVRALYDYDATNDMELTIREGDIIEVTQADVGEGWSEGRLNGKVGQFPANYVEPY